VVLSSRFSSDPRNLSEGVEGISCSPRELVRRLSLAGTRHVYVDGGRTIRGFLNSSLIQKMTITRIPILIGDGIPLFGPLDSDIDFQHIETKTYPRGFVQSTYRVMHAA
jgi:dihydrofolate reductase